MATEPAAMDTVEAFLDNEDSPDIDNPIHSTAVATRYGFRGAIVGGITVWGWSVAALLAALGEGWLDRGWTTVRFRQPTYPGDQLSVRVEKHDGGASAWRMTNQEGVDCVVGEAGLGDAPWLGELQRPATPLRPSGSVASPVLGPLRLDDAPVGRDWAAYRQTATAEEASAFARERLRIDDERFVGEQPRLHPAWLAARCEALMRHNHTVPMSMHTQSRIQLLAPAVAGQAVICGGHVVAAYERKQHHFVVFDTLIAGEDGRELALIRHTTIFRIAPP